MLLNVHFTVCIYTLLKCFGRFPFLRLNVMHDVVKYDLSLWIYIWYVECFSKQFSYVICNIPFIGIEFERSTSRKSNSWISISPKKNKTKYILNTSHAISFSASHKTNTAIKLIFHSEDQTRIKGLFFKNLFVNEFKRKRRRNS